MRLLILFWQRNKAILFFIGIAIIFLSFIICAYLFSWNWTGFNANLRPTVKSNEQYQPAKTLWDWLQLLIIPVGLAIIAVWFNHAERNNEQRATTDKERESILLMYFDRIEELLSGTDIQKAQLTPKILTSISQRTLTTLKRLDPARKASLFEFLDQMGLIGKFILNDAEMNDIDLRGTVLSNVKLYRANLSGANLSGATLNKTELIGANLSGAKLSSTMMFGTDFRNANLRGADFTDARLTNVNMNGAKYSEKQLKKAKSVEGLIR